MDKQKKNQKKLFQTVRIKKATKNTFNAAGKANWRAFAVTLLLTVFLLSTFLSGCSGPGANAGPNAKDSKSSLIDTLPEPEGLLVFNRERDWVGKDYGLIDTEGNIVLPFIYDLSTMS